MTTLTYLALIPPIVLLFVVYMQDRIEKEPLRLVLKAFFFGAIIPTAVVMLLSGLVGGIISTLGNGLVYKFARWFIQVALLEEGGKLLVLLLFIWNNREFNYRFDGIVYSVAVSLGFAALENLLYVFQYGFSTGILRAFTSIPAHTIFAVYMGYYFGEAKYHSVRGTASFGLLPALLVPVFIHGLYDYIASTPSFIATVLFYAFVIYMDIKAIKKVRGYSVEDRRFR